MEPAATDFSRLLLRLRQRALRWYEIGLYALLATMAFAVALPVTSSELEADATQCGNIQSSAAVITR